MAKDKRPRYKFTVIGYCDDSHGVNTFTEHVKARDASHAWDLAAARAKRAGWDGDDNATEIATYDGWLECSRYYDRTQQLRPSFGGPAYTAKELEAAANGNG